MSFRGHVSKDPWFQSTFRLFGIARRSARENEKYRRSISMRQTGGPAPNDHGFPGHAAPWLTSSALGNIFSPKMLVRKKGLDPLRPFGHQLLRLARLPIPPLPRRLSIALPP